MAAAMTARSARERRGDAMGMTTTRTLTAPAVGPEARAGDEEDGADGGRGPRGGEAEGSSLSLAGEMLSRVPASVTSLTGLTRLDLSSNLLTELPETLGRLRALTHLTLTWNKLRRLPASVARLSSLVEVRPARSVPHTRTPSPEHSLAD